MRGQGKTTEGEAASLAATLRKRIRGEVRFDVGSRALYATDASNYRQVPVGVVVPRSVDDLIEAVVVCREYGSPLLTRGGGTSLAGQGCNVAIIIDTSKYLHRIIDLDPKERTAVIEPGVILDDLCAAAGQSGLTFGPDPATHSRCTLGGMIGNNSCGVHSIMAGKTAENIEALEVLTYDGLRMWVGATSEEELQKASQAEGRLGALYTGLRRLRERYAEQIRTGFPRLARRISGYNLDELLPERGCHLGRALVGTEGTCALVLQAKVNLIPSPAARVVLVLGYPDIFAAGDATPHVMEHGPIGLEGIDERVIGDLRKKGRRLAETALLPPGRGWLLVEFGAKTHRAGRERAHALMAALQRTAHPPSMRLFEGESEQQQIWAIREEGAGATHSVPGEKETWPGWEDAAVEPEWIGDYLRNYQRLLDRYGYTSSLYGHFGDGCIHGRITCNLATQEGVQQWRAFLEEAADLVVRYGGSLSGEHGDGQARAELLPRMYGSDLIQAFREFKTLWDPDYKMNPGKVVNPRPLDLDLRRGPSSHPAQSSTHFDFQADQGSFANAVGRCVGLGKCRQRAGGTMCPSFRATGEEMHSTRGRARLLFEMLEGDPLTGGWRSQPVKEALDLCLACKACKAECPVQVDMATYKAEFLSHYYAGRLRPRTAYSMGLIHRWARLAAAIPQLTNLVTQTPLLRGLIKSLAGVAQERHLPRFAPQTFRQWFAGCPESDSKGPPVLLWPDTFNDHFHPETGRAAVAVLEAAGYRVELPATQLCCGRPLYDFGMLDRAKHQLGQCLEGLRPALEAGTPVIGLEPACLTTFRDELPDLFPADATAARLRTQTYSLSEFLVRQADWSPAPLAGAALLHGHCYEKAVLGLDAARQLLDRTGLNYQVLDSGCCGMAGSFGFDRHRYAHSVRIGELALLPAVRAAPAQTWIIANGYSCREQIAQHTKRRALHLAEVLQKTLPPQSRR